MKFFKNIFRKKTFEKENKSEKLRNQAMYKLDKIKKKRFSKKTIEETYAVFRIFLKNKFNIKQSLTNEEVIEKINSSKLKNEIKEKVNYIANTMNEIEFGGKTPSKKINDDLIQNLKEIIKEI